MRKNEEAAIFLFNNGYNCAQSVLSSFADALKFDLKLAQSISAGFGAGMGRQQETCGAVTGAYMVIGIYNSAHYNDNSLAKEYSNQMIQDFTNQFQKEHDSLNCKSLVSCDLNTELGQSDYQKNKLSETVCKRCISSSINILNKLIQI